MTNSVDPDQTAPIGAVCSGSTLFAIILNSPVTLGNYLQQTTSADDIFRCIIYLVLRRLVWIRYGNKSNELLKSAGQDPHFFFKRGCTLL